MNDTLDLEDRLRELAAAVPPPEVPVEDDLARGRRRLGVQRLLTTSGAVAAFAVIALGIGIGQAAMDESSEPGPAGQGGVDPTTIATGKVQNAKPEVLPQTGGELLQVYRDVLVVHLDPSGEHLQVKPDNLQSGGGLGTKLGWKNPGESGLGMVEIFVGNGWPGVVGNLCGEGAECTQQDVDGIHATVARGDGVTTVLVQRDDGTYVLLTINPLFGNNSLVPVNGMDISVDDLIRAAGDERLVEATPEQIRNAGNSMGFPDPPDFGAPEGALTSPVPPQQ